MLPAFCTLLWLQSRERLQESFCRLGLSHPCLCKQSVLCPSIILTLPLESEAMKRTRPQNQDQIFKQSSFIKTLLNSKNGELTWIYNKENTIKRADILELIVPSALRYACMQVGRRELQRLDCNTNLWEKSYDSESFLIVLIETKCQLSSEKFN